MKTDNADVEWLRERWDQWEVIDPERAQSLLAHIDKLEADIREARNEWESACERAEGAKAVLYDRRPTVHEIAAQMMAALVASDDRCLLLETLANESYRAAEALVAEGQKR